MKLLSQAHKELRRLALAGPRLAAGDHGLARLRAEASAAIASGTKTEAIDLAGGLSTLLDGARLGSERRLMALFARVSAARRPSAAPAGPLIPLSTAWPGQFSLRVSSWALRRVCAQDYAAPGFPPLRVSERPILADLRAAPWLLRMLRADNLELGFGRDRWARSRLLLAAEQLRRLGRAEALNPAAERGRLQAGEAQLQSFDRTLPLGVMAQLDPERARAEARRVLRAAKPLPIRRVGGSPLFGGGSARWAVQALVEDSSALPFLLSLPAERGLLALAQRSEPEAQARVDAALEAGGRGGIDDALCAQLSPAQAARLRAWAMDEARPVADEEERLDRSRACVALCATPPHPDNLEPLLQLLPAMLKSRASIGAEPWIGAQLAALADKQTLRSILSEHERLRMPVTLARLSPAEVFELCAAQSSDRDYLESQLARPGWMRLSWREQAEPDKMELDPRWPSLLIEQGAVCAHANLELSRFLSQGDAALASQLTEQYERACAAPTDDAAGQACFEERQPLAEQLSGAALSARRAITRAVMSEVDGYWLDLQDLGLCDLPEDRAFLTEQAELLVAEDDEPYGLFAFLKII